MRALVPALLIGSLVFAAMLYVNANNPDLLDNLLHKKTAAPSRQDPEHYRLERIRELYEAQLLTEGQMLALRNRNIYLGAGSHFVQLAWGEPKSISVRPDPEGGSPIEIWTYQLDIHPTPHLLTFRNNTLVAEQTDHAAQNDALPIVNPQQAIAPKSVRPLPQR